MANFPEHFERQYQSHLKHLKLKGLQPKTIEAYTRSMRRIGEYFSYQIDALSEEQLVEYFTDLINKHSRSGVKLDLNGLKSHDNQVWLQRQLQSLVPATYFLVTFTLPAELRSLAWSHQRTVYALLMQCAWDTLATCSRNDPKLRATPGAVGVLHTHNRRLDFHPHVHMVVPAAALDTQRGLWRTKSRRSRHGGGKHKAGATNAASTPAGGYLFNHKALAKVFRAKVLDAVERAGLTLPDKLLSTWVVDCRCVSDGSKALLYLGRYLYRGVVQEADILRCDDSGQVSFRYRDAKTGKAAVRTLPGAAFLWLVLQHVLPKGLRRARNFGFLHPNSAGAIRLLQVLHLRAAPTHAPPAPPRAAWRCVCGQPMFVVCRRMPALQPDVVGQRKPSSAIRSDNPDASQARTMH